MTSAKVTSRGRITVPREVRQRLVLRPGDRVEFLEKDGAFFIRKWLPADAFKKWRGFLKHLAGRDSDELVREMRGE